jgi:two-component system chemotaxis response regulator CheY
MGKKIMIVDDAAFMRMMLKNILTKGGYEICEEATDGLQAVEKYSQCSPDLVIMDITMPNMDGIAALKKIKEENPDSKIIMCSAMGQESLVIDAIRSGALDFIVKPFQNDRLIAAISRVLPN